jgi:formylglycine-generating enzyme required for sulfatase activity
MSLFAMQVTNAFSARELSNSQSLLKDSIHKLSSGTRLVKSRDDAGMLSVQMKMNADSYRNASAMGQIGNAVSFLDMQDGMLNNAQNILTRMSELKGLSTNDPMKSEQDIDAYNNEFHELQVQLNQLSKQTFNGTSLFATTTEMYGGNAVKFRGNESEENTFNISANNSTTVISIAKLSFLDALNIEGCRSSSVDNYFVQLDSTTEIEMLKIEPGTFMMGSPTTEADRQGNEAQHRVTISKEYYLGKYEVTQAQYAAVMDGNNSGLDVNPSYFSGNPNRPVENISWNDIQVFLTRLNDQQKDILSDGWEYVLPTEAEWEYAARAGTQTAYSWGDSINATNANYGNNIGHTTDVGQYTPNPLGLHDMHGNAWEWTDDWYGGGYSTDDAIDPQGANNGNRKLIRSGSYLSVPGFLRSARRNRENPGFNNKNVGFRLALKKSDSNVSDLNELLKITAANEDNKSTLNLSDFNASYFERAIENISYLRAQTSATKSRLKFTGDSIQNLKTLSSTAIGRISDVDYAMENSKLAKQKFLSSSSAAMIAQANSMGDVLLTMLN